MTAKKQSPAQPGLKRIFIVDDHPIVRQGLAKLLSDEKGLVVCGEAENAREAFQAIGKLKPDLAIVDISLSGKTGLELIKDIRSHYPELPVLVMSMYDELIYAERALRAGGRGYIMKQQGGKILVQAIRQVLSGQVYVSPKISASILDRLSAGRTKLARSPVENLTEREFEVFQLISQGLATREIAEQLHVSVKTVEVHRVHIKAKLQVKEGPALMHYAISWEATQRQRVS
jgi:DNA-binding NarL/FixJ family response regulator